MNQSAQPGSPSPPKQGRSLLAIAGLAVLVLIVVLSFRFAGYNQLNPHVSTVTQQQFLTNTQSLYNTQTVTSFATVTSVAVATSTTTSGHVYTYSYYQTTNYQNNYYPNTYCGYNCRYPGPYPGSWNPNTCQPTSESNSTVQCSGYLSQYENGCLVLAIPVQNPDLYEDTVYLYYTLHNLPSSYPAPGSWVTLSGQLYQGYNQSPTGAACPGNYVNVTSIF